MRVRVVSALALQFSAVVAVVLATGLAAPARADPPPVTVNDPTVPEPTTFPPDQKPADLPANEDADTKIVPKVTAGDFQFTFDGTQIKFISLTGVAVDATISVRLPTNADPTLKGHEQGHVDLYTEEYKRLAKAKAEDTFRNFVGTKVPVPGATAQERKQNSQDTADKAVAALEKRAAQGIADQTDTLNKKYDKLTDSGTSKTVNTADGKAAAKKELGLAQASGLKPLVPLDGFASAASGPALVTLDPDSFRLSFDMSGGAVAFTSCGGDPLDGATISIGSLQVIGQQENGTMRLGSGELNIASGDSTLLHGYLWEMAYMPSSLPGFAGMIQGYLDIPPPFTGAGITNSIGSCFLDQEQALFDTDSTAAMSTFWLFTNDLMFGDDGQVATFASVGMMLIGAADIAEPGTLALFGASLVGLGLLRRRRS
ncbi:MAG: PEP-CTERM sorting domain-containing protein [Proteobacteria bacterium]|nr:PEP-CTERM sorting domain-containing protein [Pseudomonadota bacterium]